MERINLPKGKKTYSPHPKTELCLALNIARHRFVEILRYVVEDDRITEENWKNIVVELRDVDKIRQANEKQQKLVDKLKKYLPFIKPENDNLNELKMLKIIGNLLRLQRNLYSHQKHKPIILKYDEENKQLCVIKKMCDLFAEAKNSLIDDLNNTYEAIDMSHLELNKDRRDEDLPSWLNPFVSKSKPEEKEYSLFYKSDSGYELSERGAMFLASLFLDKKEAVEFLGGMTGFKKTDGNKFSATRSVFTYYSGKEIFERKDTKDVDVSLFFNMVSYLDKVPKCIKEEGDDVRNKDLFGHFAIRYLLIGNDDIKVRQYTGKSFTKPREAETSKGVKISIIETKEEKIYSEDLQKKIFLTGNNIYFKYKGQEGEMGFKALSHLVFAKLLRNEIGYDTIYDEVKEKINRYIIDYKAILSQIKSGSINSPESLQEKLKDKLVDINEIPEKIQKGLTRTGVENEEEFIGRVLKRLAKKIEDCEERLKRDVQKERVYDMVTFMLHDFMDSLGRGNKPGKGLYKRLHNNFTFYGRYREKLYGTLKNKYRNDYPNSILKKALDEIDLRDVYRKYLNELKVSCIKNQKDIEEEQDSSRKVHKATELSYKLGMSQMKYDSISEKEEERTSSAKDISDMILKKPIPIPVNLISKTILDKIKIEKDGKEIERVATLIDLYLAGKGFDVNRSDKEKNVMLSEYYHDIDSKYEKRKLKKVRLSRTHDKLIRLIIGEYAKGFIKDTVKLEIPDDIPVTKLYHSEVVMDFFDRKIKFPFDKYNKVKKLLYDKRIKIITEHHIDKKINEIEYIDVPEKISKDDKKKRSSIIDEQKDIYKKSQKRIISEALKYEERFWDKHDFDTLLSKYTKYHSHIEHKNILIEAGADESLGDFRNNALHNVAPVTEGYFKDVIEKYEKL